MTGKASVHVQYGYSHGFPNHTSHICNNNNVLEMYFNIFSLELIDWAGRGHRCGNNQACRRQWQEAHQALGYMGPDEPHGAWFLLLLLPFLLVVYLWF